jgi:hypothetical protein
VKGKRKRYRSEIKASPDNSLFLVSVSFLNFILRTERSYICQNVHSKGQKEGDIYYAGEKSLWIAEYSEHGFYKFILLL